ncbi:MAG: flagellar biosynthetic protein FliR [bacterium]|nr:flagellar biosynthetic protein FliR [bacterium]
MFDFVDFAAAKLQLFLLIMLRASGLFLIAPILSHRTFPVPAKLGMVVLFGLIMVAAMPNAAVPEAQSLSELVTLAAKEIFVGLAIGFLFSLLLMGVQMAGDIISYQIGFAMASIMDPDQGHEVTTLGQFWFLCALLIFLGINGHHVIISAFNDSYQLIPAGHVVMNGAVGEMIMTYSAYVFVIALKLAAPVVVTLLLVDVAMGVVSRMMPTMNVFLLGFGVKVAVGIAIMALSLPVFAYVLEKATGYLDNELITLLGALGRA